MSFYSTEEYPNRKDWRRPGKTAPSCNPGGSCAWCRDNRLHSDRKREAMASVADEEPDDTFMQDAD